MPSRTRPPEVSPPRQPTTFRRQPRSPRWRLRLWEVLLFIGLFAIFCRLFYLQIIAGPDLTKRATVQRQQTNLLIHRGAITDRHGLPLAIDTTRYDIYIHPGLLKVSTEQAVDQFSRITKVNREKVKRLLTSDWPVVTLARHLGREEVDELQALNWTGIDIVPRSFRHYPEAKLAAHILGYVNFDTHGQGGIEQAEEDMLQDTGNLQKPQLDGHGRPILTGGNGQVAEITPPMGRHVELTIDNYLQHLAEKELTAMCSHAHAQRGTVLITNPTTGEILAWANWPRYDPNEYHKYPFEVTKNWAMVDVYQPGSTFKILTVSSGLDTGVINPHSTFVDNGTISIGNRTLHNHDGGFGTIDLLHLFIHSSNVASAQIGLRMTPKQFYDKLWEFGLGHPTGIDLPGESSGLLTNWKKWQPIDQATTGFGQGAMAVTPLQLVAAVGAVANRGVWVQPHLIRRIYDPKSGVTEKWTIPEKHRVIKEETATLVCHLLGENIALGSQIAGQVPGYRVGGKTGTAQKPNAGGRGYQSGQTIASFIGFLPAENAQLLCIAIVDGPQTDGRWGNTVAGPVFNSIVLDAARYLGLPTTTNPENNKKKAADLTPPSIKYAAEVHETEKDKELRQ
ncbi:MAG: penicillin-binding protein 2 [Candidatus Obscuribacterales bacterium]